ncbi:hypothetical protein [Paraburkholderia diazotrophica]|uniref:Uncharacterized protein n=1 Tax=Paraburkholderia diazotrophica TaxID=667676 RepID=A0A1H7EG33_9BURK|nr:hypothetical protein [Paraburkholderia diazotrophica]SEK12859.1 hypothetical protein SAMN05192539_106121 [Paraburkholderia diazotrophica]
MTLDVAVADFIVTCYDVRDTRVFALDTDDGRSSSTVTCPTGA